MQQKGRARHGQLAVPRRAADERPREGRLSRSHVAVEQEDVPWFSPGGEQRGEARRAPLARGDKGEGGSFQIAAAAAASVFSPSDSLDAAEDDDDTEAAGASSEEGRPRLLPGPLEEDSGRGRVTAMAGADADADADDADKAFAIGFDSAPAVNRASAPAAARIVDRRSRLGGHQRARTNGAAAVGAAAGRALAAAAAASGIGFFFSERRRG